MKKKVFSGIQPSGNLHIGNYLATIHKWVREQDGKDNIFCVVDLHAITVPQEPTDMARRTLEIPKIFLAAGIDPKKSIIFLQSSRPEHTELGWILNCFTYFGEASRMTQFKDKARNKKEAVSVGLFDYPILMAADILLYDTDEVPVGDDQKQHVELARDVATRINKRYGDILKIPEFTTNKAATRIMSLSDPTVKMSKSDENENSRIEILDSPSDITKKIARAVTDSDNEIRYDREKKPGVSNLLNILSSCSQTPIKDLEKKYVGVSYGQFKGDVAQAIIEVLAPFQQRYAEISDEEVKRILREGSKKVAPIATNTLERVKKAVGLGID